MTRWDPAAVSRYVGGSIVPVARAELHEALLGALPDGVVRLGTEVTSVPQADLVVAADGIYSRLRALRWPEVPPPAYNGVTTWRGIAPTPSGGTPPLTNSWGGDGEFGVVPLADRQVYWFAALPAPEGLVHDDERAAILERFGDWHSPHP